MPLTAVSLRNFNGRFNTDAIPAKRRKKPLKQ